VLQIASPTPHIRPQLPPHISLSSLHLSTHQFTLPQFRQTLTTSGDFIHFLANRQERSALSLRAERSLTLPAALAAPAVAGAAAAASAAAASVAAGAPLPAAAVAAMDAADAEAAEAAVIATMRAFNASAEAEAESQAKAKAKADGNANTGAAAEEYADVAAVGAGALPGQITKRTRIA